VLVVVLGVLVEEAVVVDKVILIAGMVVLVRGQRVRSCLVGERGSRRVGRNLVLSRRTSKMLAGNLRVVVREVVVENFVDCSYFLEMGARS